MNRPVRALIFGTLAGALWSLIPATVIAASPGDLLGGFRQVLDDPTMLARFLSAGLVTGCLVSFLAYRAILRWGTRGALLTGILILPIAGFIFGFLLPFAILSIEWISGTLHHYLASPQAEANLLHPWGGALLAPLFWGTVFAGYSVLPELVWFLLPLSVATTLILRVVLAMPERADASLF